MKYSNIDEGRISVQLMERLALQEFKQEFTQNT